jgi:PBSX family phage terminase large subunit
MQPVKASGWFNSNLSKQDQQTLIKAGITPVNDIFYHLWGNKNPINLLYGGYGSGKSVFIETDLLEKSMQPEYFRCYYGRKVLEDVRGSVHSKYVSIIKDNGLQKEFQYSEEPNGSMVIKSRATGNLFLPFGASKPESLKSIDDPTHFFLEEMDQFSQKDFAVILSRLRTEKGNLQLYGAFNTASVMPDHWMLKTLFPEFGTNSFENQELIDVINAIGITKLFCNYTDNHFINQEDYYNKLKLTASGDGELLEAIAKGAWGTIRGVNPFATQYTRKKHESLEAIFDKNKQLLIKIDFNLNPFAVNFSHMWRDDKGEHFHTFNEASIEKGSIPAMVDLIKTTYANQLPNCIITGDAMGKRGEISQRDNASNYRQLQRGLNLKDSQMWLPANPTHENSRADTNYVLCHFPDYKINPLTCPQTCLDMRTVQCDAFGSIIKKNRNDLTQRADFIDCERYGINTFLKKWIESHMKIKR